MSKYIIALVGPSGSGKSTIEKLLVEKNCLRKAVSHTSREIRPGEEDGNDYYFVTKDEFLKLTAENKLVEFAEYNGNYYGVSKEEIDKSHVIVIEPNGLVQVDKYCKESRKKLFSIYLTGDPSILYNRMTDNRGDASDAAIRRIINDQKHFADSSIEKLGIHFNRWIDTSHFTIESVYEMVLEDVNELEDEFEGYDPETLSVFQK